MITVLQEVSKEGITWSILSVPDVSYNDSGKYVCRASNLVGSTDATISLIITDVWQASETMKKTSSRKNSNSGQVTYQDKLLAQYIPLSSSSVGVPISELINGSKSSGPESSSTSDGISEARLYMDELNKAMLSNLAASASSLKQVPERRVVRSVKVIGDTDHTVTINWRAPSATNTTSFSVLYAVFGERDMRRINVSPGKNRITIDGLVPKTKYIVCVCVKGLIPKKEQCVIFSTDEAASASGTQKLINVVVITVACIIAVPLTLIVCCGALKRRLQKIQERRSKDNQDSYVTIETLTPSAKAKGMEVQFQTQLNQDESNRLLSARSSVDSEAVIRTEGNPDEYFC